MLLEGATTGSGKSHNTSNGNKWKQVSKDAVSMKRTIEAVKGAEKKLEAKGLCVSLYNVCVSLFNACHCLMHLTGNDCILRLDHDPSYHLRTKILTVIFLIT